MEQNLVEPGKTAWLQTQKWKKYPKVYGPDLEISNITIEVRCSKGEIDKIRAYKGANALREHKGACEISDIN